MYGLRCLEKKRIILLFVSHCFSFVVLQLYHVVFVFIVALLSPVFCYCMLLVLSFAWRCFAVFTNVFVVPSDGVSAQALSRSSLQGKAVRRLVFDDRRGALWLFVSHVQTSRPHVIALVSKSICHHEKRHVTCMLWCIIYVCHERCRCCFSFLHHIAVSSDLGSQWPPWSNVWRLSGCLRCVLDDIGASSFCWGMEVIFGVAITFLTLFFEFCFCSLFGCSLALLVDENQIEWYGNDYDNDNDIDNQNENNNKKK